jgi:hypothetical protein
MFCCARFGFHDRKPDSRATIFPEHIQAATKSHARLLASRTHPLINDQALEILNQRASAQNWEVDYGVVDLSTFVPRAVETAEAVSEVLASLPGATAGISGALPTFWSINIGAGARRHHRRSRRSLSASTMCGYAGQGSENVPFRFVGFQPIDRATWVVFNFAICASGSRSM